MHKISNLDLVQSSIENSAEYKILVEELRSSDTGALALINSQPAYIAMLAEILRRQLRQNHLIVCQDKEQALFVQNDIENLADSKEVAFLLPEIYQSIKGKLYYNQSHDVIKTESLMRAQSSHSSIWVTYPEALIEKVQAPTQLSQQAIWIKVGDHIDTQGLITKLVDLGFQKEDFVYEPGTFALRGDILDIYSYGNTHPFRIELFDDQVDSLRIFNPEDQLSEKKLMEINIIPEGQSASKPKELISLLSYLPEDTHIWMQNTDRILEDVEVLTMDMDSEILVQYDMETMTLSSEDFIQKETLWAEIKKHNIINTLAAAQLSSEHLGAQDYNQVLTVEQSPQPIFNKNFDLFEQELIQLQKDGYAVYIFAENSKQLMRIQSILDDKESQASFVPVRCTLSEGFIDHSLRIACFTDHQIFNRYHKYRVKQAYNRKKAFSLRSLQSLSPGDYIVHINHGVGKFSGLETIDVNGNKQEAVRILYKDNDILYVSTNSLHKISKYTGKEGTEPTVHKIGSSAWEKKKQKAKNRIKALAFDLINLYAKRKASGGHAHSPDNYLQNELEASFYYEDTPDQLKATQQVKEDMEKELPMDRLVCGDVGFGKTEVAVRAAFKSVCDSKQVAVLVPTTILAYQHYQTFKERLAEFPVNVDYINRFKTTKEKNETLKKLEAGQIDILIGTHAILNPKVKFKDLGLLIIDEEQKFGVGAKEKLKNIRVNVDTLTLTATPIPRTLQFSLIGARDLSIMSTPPPNRQPVHTEIGVFDEQLIKEGILYELERGGQVYFVHNRIQSLEEISSLISNLVPSARVVTAHGQMEGKTLEKKLMAFINKEYDILVSTNIIESGVDIPNANTIFINNANQFGLSDLHQLRGRVGRSNQKAFCYLLAPPMSILPDDSKKRLMALEQYNELGSGFQIAMRDLDIRGAGDILGAEQSGFINDIGYEMYQKILKQAMRELKENEFEELLTDDEKSEIIDDCTIDTDLELLIPADYVQNIQERLSLYTRLDNMESLEQIDDFRSELTDRFGSMPEPVHRLIQLVECRWLAQKLGIERVSLKKSKARLYFVSDAQSKFYESALFQNLMKHIQLSVAGAQFRSQNDKFSLVIPELDTVEGLYTLLQRMSEACIIEPVAQ